MSGMGMQSSNFNMTSQTQHINSIPQTFSNVGSIPHDHLHSGTVITEQKINTNIPVTTQVPTTNLREVHSTVGVTAQVPTTSLRTVHTEMPVTASVGTASLRSTMQNIDVIAEVPITTTKQVTTMVDVEAEVPVTVLKKVKKMVEVETEIPVTRLEKVRKMVEVETEVPVTELKKIITQVPVTTDVPVQSMKQIHTTVPVETQVPVQGMKKVATTIGVDSQVPVQGMKQVQAQIAIDSTVPVAEGIKTGHTNIPVHADVRTQGIHEHVQSTNYNAIGITNLSQNLNQRTEIIETQKVVEKVQKPIEVEVNIRKETIPQKEVLVKETLVQQNAPMVKTVQETGIIREHIPLGEKVVTVREGFTGNVNCKSCHGSGYRISKKHHNQKPCKHCASHGY